MITKQEAEVAKTSTFFDSSYWGYIDHDGNRHLGPAGLVAQLRGSIFKEGMSAVTVDGHEYKTLIPQKPPISENDYISARMVMDEVAEWLGFTDIDGNVETEDYLATLSNERELIFERAKC